MLQVFPASACQLILAFQDLNQVSSFGLGFSRLFLNGGQVFGELRSRGVVWDSTVILISLLRLVSGTRGS
jgi:hypothetical protein